MQNNCEKCGKYIDIDEMYRFEISDPVDSISEVRSGFIVSICKDCAESTFDFLGITRSPCGDIQDETLF